VVGHEGDFSLNGSGSPQTRLVAASDRLGELEALVAQLSGKSPQHSRDPPDHLRCMIERRNIPFPSLPDTLASFLQLIER